MSELDKILVRLAQLGIAPIAIEKIAAGEVFEAHNEAKQAIKELFLDIVGHTSFTKGDTYDKTLIVSTIANFQQELRQKIKKL